MTYLFLAVVIAFLSSASTEEKSTVLASNSDTISLATLYERLNDYDVAFVGEEHDSPEGHRAELELLSNLFDRDSTLVMGLEMFERDVQHVLDSYLAGEIDESAFLEGSRPWPNYETDYRPLVEFARSKGIPVVAANVPRRMASLVSRSGDFSPELFGEDSVYLPAAIDFDSEEYRERFMSTMEGMPHAGPMGAMNPENLFKAQALKDAVMASSLSSWLERGRKVLFFCGRFHSDYHLGIPYQLEKSRPGLNIAVVTLLPYDSNVSGEEFSRVADFIMLCR